MSSSRVIARPLNSFESLLPFLPTARSRVLTHNVEIRRSNASRSSPSPSSARTKSERTSFLLIYEPTSDDHS